VQGNATADPPRCPGRRAATLSTRNRILGTYVHDPEMTGFCCSWYTGPDGIESKIYGARIDLSFSGTHVEGSITVRTKEGDEALVEVRGCTCPCT